MRTSGWIGVLIIMGMELNPRTNDARVTTYTGERRESGHRKDTRRSGGDLSGPHVSRASLEPTGETRQ